mgnify:CR=1 FL=1
MRFICDNAVNVLDEEEAARRDAYEAAGSDDYDLIVALGEYFCVVCYAALRGKPEGREFVAQLTWSAPLERELAVYREVLNARRMGLTPAVDLLDAASLI